MHCRQMLSALPPPRPGNHLHPPSAWPGTGTRLEGKAGQEVMTTPKILGRGNGGSGQRISRRPARLRILLALMAATAAAVVLAACGSSGGSSSGSSGGSSGSSSPVAAASSTLKTAKIGGATVLPSPKGFTLYSFAPDTPASSKCYGACAAYWPPVTGTTTAGHGLPGQVTTITRTGGAHQLTYNGHPLYTYIGDTAPGQAHGNNLNLNGGLWHEVPATR
jgi:predicted lipoprotein with Yx(FWY)xxD motif